MQNPLVRAALNALLLGVLLGWALATAPAARAAPALSLTPCQIEHPLRLTVVSADCGVLEVPENPQEPHGRMIGLRVARVAAINRRKQADPLFVLAGGPGQAASAFYASVAAAFERIQRERDIVLLDQRGTGASNPLECPEGEERLYQASDAQITAATARCLEGLRSRAHPAYYTTSLAVLDLERVRAALGYERINLYGVSYGTRVAQQYLRHFPARVRTLILDGVVPPELAVGPAVATDAEAALRSILRRCASDPSCSARFADPTRDYEAVRTRLAQHAVPLTLADPSSGGARQLDFNADHLASVLRLGGYSADYAALLPLLLHAAAGGDFAPLGAQFLWLERSYADLAVGMNNSVVCAEDVPFYKAGAPERARLAATFMGTRPLDALTLVCRIWPRGPVDQDLHAPLRSDVPALLLSGGDDPVTPPAYAAVAARGLPHALSLVLAGFGHGQLTAPCMDRVLARFLELGAVSGLDTTCTRNARPMPFFTSVNGPAP
jgi:pimeloyl-ACP methyl ester carboxylesterase